MYWGNWSGWRWGAIGVSGLAALAIIAGCGSSSKSGSSGKNSSTSEASFYTGWTPGGTPVRGGTATIDAAEAPSSFDPYIDPALNSVAQVYDELFEFLPGKGDGSQPVLVPALASSWSVSPDHLTYTFHIRPGVRFSNGQPLTGEDVVFSLKQAESPAALGYTITKTWKKISLAGPMTVKLELSKPQPALPELIAVFAFAIVPKSVWEHEGAKAFGLHPIGTGPFMVKSATPGFTKITEVRNPYYWRSGEPYLNELVFNQVESDNARILGVRSGAATIAQGIPYAQVASLEKTPGVKMLVGPEWGATDNLFNRAKAPFNEVNVRKALMYATPREEIIKAVYKGIGTPANSMWGKVKYWDPNVPLYPYDLAKAKELLKASSVPNGFNMTINIADGETEGELLASILQSSWAQIGVHATIQSISAATLFTDFFAGKYQFLVLAPEDGLLTGDDPSAASGYFESPEAGYGPPAGPKIVGLLRKATTSTGEALRTKLFGELQYDSYFQEPVAQVIVNLVTLNLVSNSLHGFQVLPNSFTRMELAWVQK